MNEPPRLVTTKPDADIAAELKVEMTAALQPVIAVVETARAAGFIINFGVNMGPLGNITITQLQVLKQF